MDWEDKDTLHCPYSPYNRMWSSLAYGDAKYTWVCGGDGNPLALNNDGLWAITYSVSVSIVPMSEFGVEIANLA